eukprot:188503_1
MPNIDLDAETQKTEALWREGYEHWIKGDNDWGFEHNTENCKMMSHVCGVTKNICATDVDYREQMTEFMNKYQEMVNDPNNKLTFPDETFHGNVAFLRFEIAMPTGTLVGANTYIRSGDKWCCQTTYGHMKSPEGVENTSN